MKYPRGILKKIRSNHGNLRSNEIEGWFILPPILHSIFVLIAEPLVEGDARIVDTTPILSIEKLETEHHIRFETRNSTYEFIPLDPSEPDNPHIVSLLERMTPQYYLELT